MDNFDLAYRAFNELRKLTSHDGECLRFRHEVSANYPEKTSLTSLTYECQIDEDWVKAIVEGLPFVAKAVDEQRQFVRTDGEVLPIEKIKEVGKDTVTDLCKHSNYISRAPEAGKPIIPDKLFMAKKENDYAVYENRFLFTLLDYLDSFITIRLKEILELSNEFEGRLIMKKDVESSSRHMSFDLNFIDTRKNDPYAMARNKAKDTIYKLQMSLASVKSLLATDLMREVSKAPKVNYPVVKTNVFKFDRNFKESLNFFEFIHSYSKKGYEVKKIQRTLSPLSDLTGDEFAEVIFLSDFLTYLHGAGLEKEMKERFMAEEARRKKEEEDRLLAQVSSLKRRLAEDGCTPFDYIAILEKGQKVYENRLLAKDQEIDDINKKHEEEILSLKTNYEEKLKEQENLYLQKIKDLEAAHAAEILSLKQEQEKALAVQASHYEEIIATKDAEFLAKQDELTKEKADRAEELAKIATERAQEKEAADSLLASTIAKDKEAYDYLTKEKDDMTSERDLLKGEIVSTRSKAGLIAPNEDFTSKERFDELEQERKAFDRFFSSEWKKAKKRIRQEVMSEPLPQKKKKDDEGKEENKQ